MEKTKITTNDWLFNIERVEQIDKSLYLNGWIAHRIKSLTHVSISINSKPWVTDLPLTNRPDVREAVSSIAPHSLQSGIAVASAIGTADLKETHNELRIVSKNGDRIIGEVNWNFRDFHKEQERVPVPPFELAQRVGGHASFLETGLSVYGNIRASLEPYCKVNDVKNVLDWGCGCGRIVRYLMEDVPAANISACDIDATAIAWDKANIPGPSFSVISAYPPTPYPSDSFDLIYGISIFTHLDEQVQNRWLDELRRISRRNGIVAVSVLGPSRAPAELQPMLSQRGFADFLSPQSAELAPYSTEDYYRVTHHTTGYILDHWARYFDILEYIQFGIVSYQDLIIMRKT